MDTYLIPAWIVLLVVLVVFEAATPQLVTIWFAFGSLVALITNLLGGAVWLQFTLFVAVSLLSLVLTRPIVKKYTQKKKVMPTNADRVIGQSAVVVEEIDNKIAKGLVTVGGVQWTARSHDEALIIPKYSEVTVDRIEGVKLIVEPKSGS